MSHSKYPTLPGERGLMWIPRKMAGKEIKMMEEFTTAMNTPSVVLVRAIHL